MLFVKAVFGFCVDVLGLFDDDEEEDEDECVMFGFSSCIKFENYLCKFEGKLFLFKGINVIFFGEFVGVG